MDSLFTYLALTLQINGGFSAFFLISMLYPTFQTEIVFCILVNIGIVTLVTHITCIIMINIYRVKIYFLTRQQLQAKMIPLQKLVHFMMLLSDIFPFFVRGMTLTCVLESFCLPAVQQAGAISLFQEEQLKPCLRGLNVTSQL